jgi:hypothetical protein
MKHKQHFKNASAKVMLWLTALCASAALAQTTQGAPNSAPEGNCLAIAVAVDEPAPSGAVPGGPLRINATFDPSVTAAQRVVIQQAIDEWQAIVQNAGSTRNPYPITFSFTNLGPGSGTLAFTTTSVDRSSGDLLSANMSFNTQTTFFVDPTPGSDCPFIQGCCVPPACQPPPPNSFDLLSVARHEMGHAVGWTSSPRVTNLMSGSDFNPPRLNIPIVTATGTHTDPAWLANDLMVPTIPTATRRPISLYPAASLVARAYEYTVPMQYVDPTYTGDLQFGTAAVPWRFFQTACTNSSGPPLLLANATHLVPASFQCGNRHDVNAARGGAVIRQ